MTLAHKNGLEHAATEETDRTLNKLKNRRVSYERSEIFEGYFYSYDHWWCYWYYCRHYCHSRRQCSGSAYGKCRRNRSALCRLHYRDSCVRH